MTRFSGCCLRLLFLKKINEMMQLNNATDIGYPAKKFNSFHLKDDEHGGSTIGPTSKSKVGGSEKRSSTTATFKCIFTKYQQLQCRNLFGKSSEVGEPPQEGDYS